MCIRDRSKDVLKKAFIERKTMQYSYVDGNLYYFMDNETFEQIPVDSEDVGDSLKFVKEGTDVTLKSYQGKVFAIEMCIRDRQVRLQTELESPVL